ncbi:replication protein A 32 kDa subunit A-like [Primulina tabacum]|uniref:replication protein A 32 kDa subunit A-like n=1 Tax=Primulina tabacum TaxID=48773 RepID=UPI003F59518B
MMFGSSQNDASAVTGGFISSQTSDPSPTSAKSRDNQPMYPVTVKQLIEASPSADDKSGYLIDGVDVYNVKLVGMTYDKSQRVTDVSFVIDDGTGRIGCHRWINDSQDTMEVEGLTDETYVRVHGHLKSVKGRRQVVVYAIRPVTNYNEIATHFLECIHSHCSSSHRIKSGVSGPSSSSLVIGTPNPYNASLSSQVSQEYNLDGLGNIDKMVLDYLQQPSSLAQEKGIHRNEIAQKLKISQEKILETMESLESEGLVYSTIDEFHYKSTAG